jgi:hypothetical protein
MSLSVPLSLSPVSPALLLRQAPFQLLHHFLAGRDVFAKLRVIVPGLLGEACESPFLRGQ